MLIICILSCNWTFAQMPNFCGSSHDAESEKFLDAFFAGEFSTKNNDDILWVPMTIHLVSPTNGSTSYNEKDLGIALCQLNEDFINTNIQFYLSSIRYINNDTYFDHTFQQGFQMMNSNNVPGTANSYLVSSPAGNCGYFSPSGGAVALAYNCTGQFSHTWAHEMGHYFSLPHTFRGWEGEDYEAGDIAPNSVNGILVEKSEDKDNCDNQADRFCDTPVDYLSFRWNCTGDQESPVIQTDPDSIEFRSDGTYFMSYSNDACMDKFSSQQMDAMSANLENTKPQQIDHEYIPVELELDQIFGTFPINDEVVTDDDVLLEWEAGDQNVIGYFVEVSKFIGFQFTDYEVFVTEPSFMAYDLQNNKTYYWRITPVSQQTFCNNTFEPYTFQTSFVTSNEEISKDQNITISPNPNQGRFILTSEEQINGNIRIFSTTNQMVYNGKASHLKSLDINLDVPSGLYILQIEQEGKKINKKFIVH